MLAPSICCGRLWGVRECVSEEVCCSPLHTHYVTHSLEYLLPCFLLPHYLLQSSSASLLHSLTRDAPQARRPPTAQSSPHWCAPHSLTHIHILTYSTFTYLTYSHTHTFTNLLTHALTHALTHSRTHSLLCSSRSAPLRAHSLTRSATALLPLLPQDRVLGTHSLTHSLTALVASPYSE